MNDPKERTTTNSEEYIYAQIPHERHSQLTNFINKFFEPLKKGERTSDIPEETIDVPDPFEELEKKKKILSDELCDDIYKVLGKIKPGLRIQDVKKSDPNSEFIKSLDEPTLKLVCRLLRAIWKYENAFGFIEMESVPYEFDGQESSPEYVDGYEQRIRRMSSFLSTNDRDKECELIPRSLIRNMLIALYIEKRMKKIAKKVSTVAIGDENAIRKVGSDTNDSYDSSETLDVFNERCCKGEESTMSRRCSKTGPGYRRKPKGSYAKVLRDFITEYDNLPGKQEGFGSKKKINRVLKFGATNENFNFLDRGQEKLQGGQVLNMDKEFPFGEAVVTNGQGRPAFAKDALSGACCLVVVFALLRHLRSTLIKTVDSYFKKNESLRSKVGFITVSMDEDTLSMALMMRFRRSNCWYAQHNGPLARHLMERCGPEKEAPPLLVALDRRLRLRSKEVAGDLSTFGPEAVLDRWLGCASLLLPVPVAYGFDELELEELDGCLVKMPPTREITRSSVGSWQYDDLSASSFKP